MKMRLTVVLAVLGGLLGATGVSGEGMVESPHPVVSQCREVYSPQCDAVCLICHALPADLSPSDTLEEDGSLCDPCHPDKRSTGGSYLLPRKGGNHPSGIVYDRYNPSLKAQPDPGPKIYCGVSSNGVETCSVLCSSCHDVMSDDADLLRVANVGSALCLSCHQK